MRNVGRTLLLVSGTVQSIYIIERGFLLGNIPITTAHEGLVFFAWVSTWSFLLFRWRHSVKNLGTFLSLLVLLLLIVSSFFSKEIVELKPSQQTLWLPIHAGLSLLAYGFLGLAFLGGLMYLLQERELKNKRFGYIFQRFPSLDSLDLLNSHCLTVGFAFLTTGLVSGALWSMNVHGRWRFDWSVLLWLFYLVQMHQRITVGWRGRRAAYMAIFGFALALFTLLGIYLFAGGVHNNG
ncbi:MAG: cytochrome c biogenesis protein [Desulfotalea sp.]